MEKKKFGFGDRFCTVCGARVKKKESVCPQCGSPYGDEKYAGVGQLGAGGIGYSVHAKDPCFKTNKKKGRLFGFLFLIVFSLGVAAYLLISKQVPADAQGFKTVAIVLSVIWGIDLIWYLSSLRKRGDWEGVVESKEQTTRTRRSSDKDGTETTSREDVYTVWFRTAEGKRKKMQAIDNSRFFDRFFEGERVRYIGDLQYYEKYDKSRETTLVCAGCGSSRDAREDRCGRCGCVMLKGIPVNEEKRVERPASVPAAPQPAPATETTVEPPAPAGSVCPHCGAQNKDGAKFCENCGEKM